MELFAAALVIVGLLCLLNLVLMFGVIRRLREQPANPLQDPLERPTSILSAGGTVGSFSVTDIAGRKLKQTSLTAGTMIVFMSPGCPPCEETLPLVVERIREYGPDRVLAIVVRDEKADPAEFIKRLSPLARVVVADFDSELTKAFALTGLPAYVEMGNDGKITRSGRTLPRRTDRVWVDA